ncbi:MAG: PEP-CTERM sorting domain-containing protein [Verrucomicrobiota bacterium]
MITTQTLSSPRIRISAALVGALFILASPASAATIFQTQQGGWNDPATWGGNAVTTGNTYSSAGGSSNTLNPEGNTTFAGDLIIINAPQVFFTGTATDITGNMELNNFGTIRRNRAGTAAFNGSINITTAGGFLDADGGGARTLTINSLLTSDDNTSVLRIGGNAADNGVILTNASNTFNGLFDLTEVGFLRSTVQGSLGFGDLLVDTGSFEATYHFDATINMNSATVASGGLYELDTFTHTYDPGTFTLDSANGVIVLGEGIYTVAELNTLAGETLFSGTTGMLSIVPEPTSGSLLAAIALVGLLARRRKR